MDHSPQWNVLSVFVSNLNRLLLQRRAASQDFPLVFLFPEGTTTNGRALISFKLGAFVPGFPVQPVVVRYPFVHLDVSW
jgi:lysophosphatidylcholine acyltransferase/lyso-PAF acetyltransferase